MKARVKLTGQIVDVVVIEIPQYGFLGECTEPIEYRITRFYDGENYYRYDELDFEVETFIYWEKLEHQFAGMAMQGMIRTVGHNRMYSPEKIAIYAEACAHALVQKLKEERYGHKEDKE